MPPRPSSPSAAPRAGAIRVGIGGWTYAPWRGPFYPEGLPHARELEYASRQLTAIEINGTYYSSQQPATFAKWLSLIHISRRSRCASCRPAARARCSRWAW